MIIAIIFTAGILEIIYTGDYVEQGRDIRKDLELSSGDCAHFGVKAGLSAIPYLGGPIAEFFSFVISPPLVKRRDEWLIEIYDRLKSLEEKNEGSNIANLQENENFISMLLYATQIAMRTHQKEKLEALKNAAINSVLIPEIDENMQMIFINIIDRYTPWHLIILNFLNDPRKFGEEKGINYPNWSSAGISSVLEHALPDLKGKNEFYDQIVKDLYNNGLINLTSLHGMMSGNGLFQSNTTNMGKDFLRFIQSDLE